MEGKEEVMGVRMVNIINSIKKPYLWLPLILTILLFTFYSQTLSFAKIYALFFVAGIVLFSDFMGEVGAKFGVYIRGGEPDEKSILYKIRKYSFTIAFYLIYIYLLFFLNI